MNTIVLQSVFYKASMLEKINCMLNDHLLIVAILVFDVPPVKCDYMYVNVIINVKLFLIVLKPIYIISSCCTVTL